LTGLSSLSRVGGGLVFLTDDSHAVCGASNAAQASFLPISSDFDLSVSDIDDAHPALWSR
jgi:hypothetical protein